MVKLDLSDKAVQNKLKHAGVRWTLRQYDNGFEMDNARAVSLGLIPDPRAPKAKAEVKPEAESKPSQ